MSARLLVLGWHNIAGTYCFPSATGVGERGFRQQMRALARGANVLALEDALTRLAVGKKLPARAVAVTFDDGYRDNLTLAAPILEQFGIPATFFLVPRLLSAEVDPWWETLGWALESSSRTSLQWEDVSLTLDGGRSRRSAYSQIVRSLKLRSCSERDTAVRGLLDQLEPSGTAPDLFMDWDDAGELVRRGFSVQSHTASHPVLSHETCERQRSELTRARRELEEGLGIAVSTIAYPHGGLRDYSAETVTIAAQAGYRWGVTAREGFTTSTTAPLEIHRCLVYPERGVVDLLAQLRYGLQAWRQGGRR